MIKFNASMTPDTVEFRPAVVVLTAAGAVTYTYPSTGVMLACSVQIGKFRSFDAGGKPISAAVHTVFLTSDPTPLNSGAGIVQHDQLLWSGGSLVAQEDSGRVCGVLWEVDCLKSS